MRSEVQVRIKRPACFEDTAVSSDHPEVIGCLNNRLGYENFNRQIIYSPVHSARWKERHQKTQVSYAYPLYPPEKYLTELMCQCY